MKVAGLLGMLNQLGAHCLEASLRWLAHRQRTSLYGAVKKFTGLPRCHPRQRRFPVETRYGDWESTRLFMRRSPVFTFVLRFWFWPVTARQIKQCQEIIDKPRFGDEWCHARPAEERLRRKIDKYSVAFISTQPANAWMSCRGTVSR